MIYQYDLVIKNKSHINTLTRMEDTWVNAEEMNRLHASTFNKPTAEDLAFVKKHTFVKISNGYERFYVQITKVSSRYLFGMVSNELVNLREYNYGDIVKFKRNHVLVVRKPKEQLRNTKMMQQLFFRFGKSQSARAVIF